VLLSDIEECRNDKARTVWRKQPQDQAGKIAKKEERDEANNPIPKETKQKLEVRFPCNCCAAEHLPRLSLVANHIYIPLTLHTLHVFTQKRCRENAPKLVACYYNHATGAMESDFWGKVDKAKKAAAVAELKRRLKEVI